METQRQTLVDEARRIAAREAARKKPLVALLTGSAAWGTVSSRSDIDILFISSEAGTVSYRYYLPELTGVRVRTEVGRIPLAYLSKVLASGYSDEISTGIREQVSNALVLSGDEALGGRIVAAFARLKPKKRLLGEYLSNIRSAFVRAKTSLAGGASAEFICALDEMSRNLWRLRLVAFHHVGVQKEKHEIRAARRCLEDSALENYRESRRIEGADRAEASRCLKASRYAISRVLLAAGVSESVLGEKHV